MKKNCMKYDFTRIIFISLFVTLFFQIIDVLFNTHLSLCGMGIFIFGIFYIKIKYGTINLKNFIFLFFALIAYFMMLLEEKDMISTLYPLLINVIIYIYMFNYFDIEYYKKKIDLIRNLILFYLVINIIFYLSKNQLFVQYDGFYRFKAALPHANMLAALMYSLLFINTLKKDKLKHIIDILILIIVFLASSRIYMFVAVISYILLNYADVIKIKNIRNLIYGIIILTVIVSILIFNENSIYNYIVNTNTYKRVVFLDVNSDGRNDLVDYFSYVYNNSSILNKIFGINNAQLYYNLTNDSFSHSFTENSFMCVAITYGAIGILAYISMFLLFIIKGIKNKITKFSKITVKSFLIILMCFSTYYQDVILSTQLFMFYILALSILMSNEKEVV